MPANNKLSRHAWCRWTQWMNECEADPNYVVVIGPDERPPNLNIDTFRMTASALARAEGGGCQSHVSVNWQAGYIHLQFCWCVQRHQGLCANRGASGLT